MIWKDVVGYEGLYQVSDCGYIKSCSRYVRSKGGSLSFRPERLMKLQEDADGYYSVGLTKDGKQKGFRVNRLVAKAFIPNPNNLPIVHHVDNDKKNNSVDNLMWVTVAENTQDAVNRGALVFNASHLREISKLGTDKTSKPIRCVETGEEYYSVSVCSKSIKLGPDALVRHIIYNEPISGLHYEFVNVKDRDWATSSRHNFKPFLGHTKHNSKRVVCLNNGVEYPSKAEAERELGLYSGSVYSSIRFNKDVQGMRFRYAE